MALKCDGVFEGGGVKGIGFVGAVCELEKNGYEFQSVVGTSAGAIVASLVAAGYNGSELKDILASLDYNSFKDQCFINRFGLPGKLLNVMSSFGIYKTNYFENWLTALLKEKGVNTFGDLKTNSKNEKYMYKFQAIASDISQKQILILPRDLQNFGLNPDSFSVARAVKMSMSIPFYFRPSYLKDTKANPHVIVDGGLLSNYPIWLLDDGTSSPPWPTFGLKFSEDSPIAKDANDIHNLLDYSKAIITTMLEAGDNYHISTSKGDYARTMFIPTAIRTEDGNTKKTIESTYFDITPNEAMALFDNGVLAAHRFLERWDFERWKKIYRS